MSWSQIYNSCYQEILKELTRLDGIAVGFNTNVDAIIEFNSTTILELIGKVGLDSLSLYERILKWKGAIDKPADFVVGLCGCFEKGKASEWLIQNDETYHYLLNNLPIPNSFRIGGQAGIMANILAEFGIQQVIVHTATLPYQLTNLFLKKKNLVIPYYDKKGKLTFINPRKLKIKDQPLYFHIIAEVKRNDTLHFGDTIKWKCPRDNRFIATYDPPNFELQIMDAFQKDIEVIAERISGFIISGFHMLEQKRLGKTGLIEKIDTIVSLVERAKKQKPSLFIHLELSSTKNDFVLDQIYKNSKTGEYWDSIGCNERELIELLRAIGEKKLANDLNKDFQQENVLLGCLKICEKLNLKRFHLHQFGCYILIVSKEHAIDRELHRNSLCFASLAATEKALTGEILQAYDLILEQPAFTEKFSKPFRELAKHITASETYIKANFILNGFAETPEYLICAIPSIIVDKPVFTVGLGDTISSTALAAELALRKKYMKNKK
ncbi:MAG: ADP-dependent glucokinase/phosphofructokinase [Candidatus Heimdallarchaeota archaeon]|nr:ADP-dependent glucokinase/phosphofructokinase [Candidatus Heimdallarchaeota archaeon]